jgi:hypothetical protein
MARRRKAQFHGGAHLEDAGSLARLASSPHLLRIDNAIWGEVLVEADMLQGLEQGSKVFRIFSI